jgi:hypothetical protein
MEQKIRIAMLGMVDGNGHPYSWSAIFNGYDREAMEQCPFPVIPQYLGQEPESSFGLGSARVTHVWTDDPADAEKVARASLIPNIVQRPEDVIGEVDAVIVATDKGWEHVDRCRPFVEAGLPIFVDKPLVDNAQDLNVFRGWMAAGARIMSSSCMAYAREFQPYRLPAHELGQIRYISVTTPKSWERYGIHALSAVYPILGPGFLSGRNTGSADRNIVHFKHVSGADVVVAAIDDMYGGFGCLQLCGTAAAVQVRFKDTFYAFKEQLADFVRFLQTGLAPYPFSVTEELMQMVIAGVVSRTQGGAEISLSDI